MYQFPIGLQDLMSSPMMQLATRFDATVGKMQQKVDRLQSKWKAAEVGLSRYDRMMNRMRNTTAMDRHIQSVDRFASKLEKLQQYRNSLDINVDTREIRRANREMETLERQMQRAQNMGRRHIGGGGGGGLLAGGGLALAGGLLLGGAAMAGGSIVNRGMEREQTQMRFNLTAGKEQGGALLKGLNKYADDTPFENRDIINAAQTMLPAFDAKSILGRTKMLGNISAGTGVDMGDLSESYTKARNSYYVQNDVLDRFEKTPVIRELAKVLHVNETAIKKMAEQNKITFDDLDKTLYQMQGKGGVYENFTDNLAQSSGGKFSTLAGTFQEKMTDLGLRTLPLVNAGLDGLNGMIGEGGGLTGLLDQAQETGGLFLKTIGGIGQTMGLIDTNGGKAATALDGVNTMLAGLEGVAKTFRFFLGGVNGAGAGLTAQNDALGKYRDTLMSGDIRGALGQLPDLVTAKAGREGFAGYIREDAKNFHAKTNADLAQSRQSVAGLLLPGQLNTPTGLPFIKTPPVVKLQPPAEKTKNGLPWAGVGGGGAGGGIGKAAGLGSTVEGSKSRTVTINIGSVVGATTMNVSVASLREAATEFHDMMHEEIQRAAYGALAADNGATD